ncbi:MAG: hypothetical protein LUI14_14010 [Lachnospiraceae bacterium]|nr:hypothetical protein [Lachnospiraceae bacterium]
MRNRKRFMALLLATVLVCSQVPSIGSSVTAEETEVSTEVTEAAQTSDDTDNTDADSAEDTQTGELVGLGSDGAAVAASDEGADGTGTDAGTDDDGEDIGSGEGSDDSGEDTGSGEGGDDSGEDTGSVEDSGTGKDDADNSDAGEDEDTGDGSDTGDAGDTGDDDGVWLQFVGNYHSYENESEGFERILVGATATETITFYSYLYKLTVDDEGNNGWTIDDWKDVALDESYTLDVDYNDYSDIVEVNAAINDDGGITLTSTGLLVGTAEIFVNVLKDEEVFYTATVWYSVRESYYELESDLGSWVDIELGEDFDPADYNFQLYKVSYDGQNTVKEEVDRNSYWICLEDWGGFELFESQGKNDYSDDVLKKRNQLDVEDSMCAVMIYAKSTDDNSILAGGMNYITGFSILNYYIELNLTDEHLNEYGSYVVYGSDQTIELSKPDWASRYLPEGYTVTWDINDESAPISIFENDNGSWTISVTDEDRDWDGSEVSVTATAWYDTDGDGEGDLKLATSDELWFEIVIPYTEYDEIEDFTVVLGNGWWIGPTIYYYDRGYENPYGFDGNAELTSLEIVSQYEYTDDGDQLTDDVISLDGEVGSGWNVNTNKCGYANMLATYLDADGNEQSFEFVIYVSGESYSLNYAYLEETDGRVQADGTITIDTSLQYTYTTEEGYADEFTIEDYLSEGFSLNYGEYDDSIISVEITNDGEDGPDRMLSVTGLTEGGTDLYVYVTDEEGNTVADAWLWIEVTQDYYVLTYENTNVALGDTVDVGDLDSETNEYVTYKLTHYYTDEEGNIVSEEIDLSDVDAYIEFEGYDSVCWDLEEDTTELTRKGNWGTSVDVHVMLYNENSGEYEEVASCGVWFDEINYNGSLTNDVDPDSWILYTDNEMTISYVLEDDSVTIPEGAEYTWTVQGWDDEAGDWYDIPEDDAVLSWTDNEDGTITVTLNSAEYGAAYVTMIVNYEGNPIIWAAEWIDTRDERFEVETSVDPRVMLYNDTAVVTATYYLENENNSAGESGNLTITDVEIIGNYTWDEDGNEVTAEFTVATAGTDNEGNWVLTSGTESGVVTLKITYIAPITGEEAVTGEDESIRVDVWDSHWYLDTEKTEYDLVISDEEENAEDSAEIEYTVNKASSEYDDESEEWTSSVAVVDPLEMDGFTITFDGYDDSIIYPVYDSETGTITVYALANGETGLDIYAEDGEGNGFEGIWVYIRVTGQLSGEITVEDEDCEITKDYTDEDFNLADEMGISTNSDAALQYTIIQGSDVVEIDEDGNITIIGVGTAIIKVYVDETNTYTYAKVNVTIDVDKAETTITASDQTVTYGKTTTLALEAAANSDGELTYEVTSGTDVVSVDGDGIVTVKKAGVATITISATETDLYKAATKTITVTVKEAETEETEATKTAATIAPETSAQTVTYGQSIILTAENLGLTVTGDGELIFTVTSGTDVLSINGTTATTLKAGTAVITVSTKETDLYTAAEPVTITVTVNKAEGTGSVTIGSWVSGMSAADVLTALSSTNGTGNVTYYYKLQGADDSTYTTTVPTAAGNYTLMAVFAETDCYNAVSVTYDFTIVDSETPSTDTPSTETETPSTDTPSTVTETPSTETPSTEIETPSTESETTATESETTATESETTATESETTVTESETDTEEVTETEEETDTEESTESTTSSASSSESETSDNDSVSTGDQTPIVLTFAIMLLAAAVLLAGAAYRRMLAGRK